MGSEMCIRDREYRHRLDKSHTHYSHDIDSYRELRQRIPPAQGRHSLIHDAYLCLLYTSDAADEEDSVDLGGRRIIKKKKTEIALSTGR